MTNAKETEIPWGHVVESDEVYSPRAGKWFKVAQIGLDLDGRVKVRAQGVGKFWPPLDPAKMVKVRRGATGNAVDILIVTFSGPTTPERVAPNRGGIGPTLDDTLRKDED